MPIESRRWPRAALLGASLVLSLAGIPFAWAQGDGSAKAERTWTDPPARGSAVTAVPDTPKAVEQLSAPKPVGSVEPRPVRTTVTSPVVARTPSWPRVRTASSHVDAPHRRVHSVSVVRPPATLRRPGIRMVTLRPGPAYDDAPLGHVRYGYTQGMMPVGRVDDASETDRDRTVRQAREAGYVVVRARTLAFPDGRRLRSYRPYDPDDSDD